MVRLRLRGLPALAALAGVTLAGVASCGSAAVRPSGPRAVTTAEANRLAIMRFLGYEAGGQHFHTVLATGQGPVTLDGDVDYRQKVGYAEITQQGDAFTLQWDASTLLAWPATQAPRATQGVPAALPGGAPTSVRLTPTSSDIDALLALVLQLGQDRPDNAQLIAQDGARWIRSTSVGNTAVAVLEGPRAAGTSGPAATDPPSAATATTTATAAPTSAEQASAGTVDYWVDARGHLLRVDATLGGSSTAIMLTGTYAGFPVSPLLTKATG